ncbi:DUF7312 domain-containing protein [Halococcus agarilyticus]|uniref:DUF7312 domain-containing protein n=1 Tax=Halococcus agarilyticus TaxID=1232219 RepID=UPI000677F4B7|nr:hypothetical protein [Halococcus agarilyticus]
MTDDADDWKYAVEDFEESDEDGGGAPETEGESGTDQVDGQATDVFGEAGATDIEPGSPSLENTLFVCLGVAVALLVILGI